MQPRDMHKEASQWLNAQRHVLAQATLERLYQEYLELDSFFQGLDNSKSIRDLEYHLQYLSTALSVANPVLFSNYIAWAKILFAGLNFPEEMLPATLRCMAIEIGLLLPESIAGLVSSYIETGIAYVWQEEEESMAHSSETPYLSNLYREYLAALLNGERHKASDLIMQAVENKTSIKDIYLHVFQSSQREIGRLWQTNQISVAQEHYCTAVTQMIMSQLYPYIFNNEKIGRRLVATCVGGELHEIGVRMVADFFEMAGWDTYYLGANTPTESIIQSLEEHRADVLGISATMNFHISKVEEVIQAVRTSPLSTTLKILVGGYPFNSAPDLWEQVGADGWGVDASSAIAVANQWLDADGAQ